MPSATASGLIGRDAELAAISRFLDASADRPFALVVRGDVGIGKTAVLDAAIETAHQRGFLVLETRPAAPDEAVPFAGLDDVLRNVPEGVVADLPDPQRRAIEVAIAVRDPDGEPPAPLSIGLGVRGVLARLADDTPVLVVVDDAQWLDQTSAAALLFALRRLDGVPVEGAFAIRPDVGRRSRDEALDLRRDEMIELPLAPLSDGDIATLLRIELGRSPTRATLRRVHEVCRGNPLFSLEVARALLDWSGEMSGSFQIPPDLRAFAGNRLADAPTDARQAVLVLAAISERSAPDVAAGLAPDAVAKAVDAGLLRMVDGRPRVVHPLYATVVYADADPEERRAVHRRLAELLDDPDERARHLALAADGPDADVAAKLEEAAHRAARTGAPAWAAELAHLSDAMTPPEAVDDAARRSLLAAECHLDSGELDRARGILEDLATRLATGPTRGVVLQRLGWVRYHQDSWPAATDLYAAAATESKEDPNLLAAIALDSSSALLLAGDVPGAGRAAQEAFDRAAELDDAHLLSDASAMVASVDFLLGRGLDEAGMVSSVERETWTRPRPTMQHPTVAFGVLLKWAGGLDRAHELLATAKRRAEEQGTERSLPFILFHLAELECWIGDWAAAEEHVRSAMTLAEATRQEGARAFALAAWALLASLRGLEAEVRQAAADGFEAARLAGAVPATLMLESVLGFLELSLGNPARAHRHLAPLVESAVRTGISEPGAIRFLGDGIEAMIGIGDTEPASAIVEHLMERSRELDRVWGLVVAGRCLGLLRSASGDAGGAEAALQRALEESQRLHQPLERGRTLLALGVVRRRDRQKRPARDVLEQGRAIFEELGADLWAQRASAELGRIGGRATSSVALTPTEERVARMVADGATNQEAASTLFLSVKTVEWNLSRVYRKLGIRSRTELVRWMGDNATAGH